MIRLIIISLLTGLTSSFAMADAPNTVFLEELTWTEVRAAINSGTTTIIIPTAGTEQNGPHMVLGKHKYRINAGSERIARALGNALVAPVMTYVPEGEVDPPSGHMRYAGTISIPNEVFMSVLEYAARSFRTHGFTDILLIGDSGGNQQGMMDVAEMLSEEWATDETRVHHISEWYITTSFKDWLRDQGETKEAAGTHAGLLDTSTLLAVAPQHVRQDNMSPGQGGDVDGVGGDPTRSSAEVGRVGMDLYFQAAMTQINQMLAGEPKDTP